MFCTKADISWNTRSSSLLSRSSLVDHGVDHSLDPSFTIFQPCFWLGKRIECDTCTFDRVSFVWLTLAIATIPFSCFFFCHVEHCQLTSCCVWHEGLPDHLGLVKTRGHLIMLRHAIGWNLRVCLFWLTGVESSIISWPQADNPWRKTFTS